MPKKISEIEARLMLKAIGKKLREVGKGGPEAMRFFQEKNADSFFQNEAAQESLPPRKPQSKSPRKRG